MSDDTIDPVSGPDLSGMFASCKPIEELPEFKTRDKQFKIDCEEITELVSNLQRRYDHITQELEIVRSLSDARCNRLVAYVNMSLWERVKFLFTWSV